MLTRLLEEFFYKDSITYLTFQALNPGVQSCADDNIQQHK